MYGVRGSAAQACEDDMNRHLLIITIFLLLGAVVNVAVAWGIAIWSGPIPTRIENFREVNQSLPEPSEGPMGGSSKGGGRGRSLL